MIKIKCYLLCGHQCCVNGSAALLHVFLYRTSIRNTMSFLENNLINLVLLCEL